MLELKIGLLKLLRIAIIIGAAILIFSVIYPGMPIVSNIPFAQITPGQIFNILGGLACMYIVGVIAWVFIKIVSDYIHGMQKKRSA
jgi:hypothetical protein